jgi:hypothetical protein
MIAVAMFLFGVLIVAWLMAPDGKPIEAYEPSPQLQPDATSA